MRQFVVGAWDLSYCHLDVRSQPMGDDGVLGSMGLWRHERLSPSLKSRNFKRHCLCQADAPPSEAYLQFLGEERTAHRWLQEQYSVIYEGKRRQAIVWNIILFGVILPMLALLPSACHRMFRRRLCRRLYRTLPCAAPDSTNEPQAVVDAQGMTGAGISSVPQDRAEISVAVELLKSATVGAELLYVRVSFATAWLGYIILLVALLPSLVVTLVGQPSLLDSYFYAHGSASFFVPLAPWGLGLLLLSLRPIDRIRVDRVCMTVCIVFFVGGIGALIGAHLPDFGQGGFDGPKRWVPKTLKVLGFYFIGVAFLHASYLLLPCIHCVCQLADWPSPATRFKLHRLWRVQRKMYMTTIIICLNTILAESIDMAIMHGGASEEFWGRARLMLLPWVWTEWAEYNGKNPVGPVEVGNRAAWTTLVSVLVALFAFSSTNRSRIVWFLGSFGREGDRMQEAAYIKALLGDHPMDHLTTTILSATTFASERFRAIHVADLTIDTFIKRPQPPISPGPHRGPNSHTSRLAMAHESSESGATLALFGEVDAFVSHSWQDSSHATLAELGNWSAETSAPGSSPRIWIDVACMRIGGACTHTEEEELRCLPFFIAGCKKLLILAGDTFPSRLWCAFEIFVFLKLGRRTNEIIMRQLPISEGDNLLKHALLRFDARNTQCYSDIDQQLLLAIIESSYGSAAYFDQSMRKIFRAILNERG